MNPIAQIREFGIPVRSYGAAIWYLNDRPDLEKDEYENLIHTLTGVRRQYKDHRDARYSFLYLVQETIRKWESTDKFDMEEMLIYAEKCAQKLFTEQAYHWAEPDEEVKTDSKGNPKRKKGAKQVEALRIYNENVADGKSKIIELFMSELDMSKAGATTYFYNMKKKAES
jgi:hypothetical protein